MDSRGAAAPPFSFCSRIALYDFHRFISSDVQMTFTEISEQEYWNLGENS
jgi:hypothetical protein